MDDPSDAHANDQPDPREARDALVAWGVDVRWQPELPDIATTLAPHVPVPDETELELLAQRVADVLMETAADRTGREPPPEARDRLKRLARELAVSLAGSALWALLVELGQYVGGLAPRDDSGFARAEERRRWVRHELERHLTDDQREELEMKAWATSRIVFTGAYGHLASQFEADPTFRELSADWSRQREYVLEDVAQGMVRTMVEASAARIQPTRPDWWRPDVAFPPSQLRGEAARRSASS